MGIKPNEYFWLKGKTPIKNLKELADALEFMDEAAFSCHVNSQKNDFYNWISEVFSNRDLAGKIKHIKKSKEMHKIIADYMNSKRKIKHPKVKEVFIDPIELEKKLVNIKADRLFPVSDILHKLSKKDKCITKSEFARFSKWLKDFFFVEAEEHKKSIGDWQCQFKTYKCSLFEFLFGILIGIMITIVIYNLVVLK